MLCSRDEREMETQNSGLLYERRWDHLYQSRGDEVVRDVRGRRDGDKFEEFLVGEGSEEGERILLNEL